MRLSKFEAEFKIITPLFLGDANGRATRFRPESLKGAWRFWWRAMAWGGIRDKAANDTNALAQLRDEEIRLFGGPADQHRPDSGQSPVLFKPEGNKLKTYRGRNASDHAGEILYGRGQDGRDEYLGLRYLGFGLIHTSTRGAATLGELLRDAFTENQNFSVTFTFAPRLASEDQEQLLRALKLLGLIGGLGSRWRRGWGSLKLVRLIKDGQLLWQPRDLVAGPDSDFRAYLADLKSLLPPQVANTEIPAISAFGAASTVHVLQEASPDSATRTLSRAGARLQKLRSWGYFSERLGRHVLVGREEALQLFEPDHAFADDPDDKPAFVPERAVFGLPHSYDKRNVRIIPADLGSTRRASPLLFHIHELAGANPRTVLAVAILPSLFLPSGAVLLERRAHRAGAFVPDAETRAFSPNWDVLSQFLTGRSVPGRTPLDRIPGNLEKVWP